jgi:RNA polymerase sigma-70 factor (ECF subfamily)
VKPERAGASTSDIEAVYRAGFRAFVRTATAMLGDQEAALDVVQDAFALALRKRRAFRGDGNLEAWLWRIVVNAVRDRRKAARRASPIVPEPTLSHVVESSDDLRAQILALPDRQRLAVFLRYYAGLSYAQIAEALDVRPGTVGALLSNAHDALRWQLEEAAR